uniref:Uncharacterized protein n=1 Tax=Physcomitrium patens TaxID=3218 RepID=A0A7I4C8Z0_PHYPA
MSISSRVSTGVDTNIQASDRPLRASGLPIRQREEALESKVVSEQAASLNKLVQHELGLGVKFGCNQGTIFAQARGEAVKLPSTWSLATASTASMVGGRGRGSRDLCASKNSDWMNEILWMNVN